MKTSKNGANKNKDKKVQLNIRLSKTEKRRLKRKAIKSSLNLSEYVRALLFMGDEKNSRTREW